MTEPTALAQLRHLYQNMVNGAVRDTASAKRIAEGLLAPAIEALERGTPPAVAGEPVAWYEYNADLDAWFLAYSHNPKAKTRPLVFGDSTPQPTQAQAGAVPLTDEQIEKLRRETFSTENPFCPCDSKTMRKAVWAAERAHGIGIGIKKGSLHD